MSDYDDDISLEDFASLIGQQWDDDNLADRSSAPELNAAALTVNWRDISDENRAEACRELASWVHEWLIPRYQLGARQIPACWWQHGNMVEELSALHTAWRVCFDAADGGFGPIGWHERFALALQRPAFATKCIDGHRPERPRTDLMTPPDVF